GFLHENEIGSVPIFQATRGRSKNAGAILPPVDVDFSGGDGLAEIVFDPLRAVAAVAGPVAVSAVAMVGGIRGIETVVDGAESFPRRHVGSEVRGDEREIDARWR